MSADAANALFHIFTEQHLLHLWAFFINISSGLDFLLIAAFYGQCVYPVEFAQQPFHRGVNRCQFVNK